jgi:hypothetical protein
MQVSFFGFFFLRDQRSPDKVMEPAVSARRTEKAGAIGGHSVKSLNGSVAGTSLYTPQNADVTIAYLAHVLRAETVDLLFPIAYWHGRVLQVCATPGLTHTQQERLQRMLDRIASLQACTASVNTGFPCIQSTASGPVAR